MAKPPRHSRSLVVLLDIGLIVAGSLAFPRAAPTNPSLLSGLVWRNIGPFRAGRNSVNPIPAATPALKAPVCGAPATATSRR